MIIKKNLVVGALMLIIISIIRAQDQKEFTTNELISAIKTNNYTAVSELSKKNYSNYPTHFNKLIRQALQHEFDKINLEKLVKFFSTHENKKQSILVYSAVFDELKKRNKLNTKVLITLAFGLKNLLRGDLSSEVNAEANRLKDALPESVRNLAFASRVCIKNGDNKEYMYASSIKFNTNRRDIFTWTPGNRFNQSYWIIEPHGDVYRIKNIAYKEYLYAPSIWHVVPERRRRIYTWIPRDETDDDTSLEWRFEPYQGKVFIKSDYYNEFLLVHDQLYPDVLGDFGEGRRRVYAKEFPGLTYYLWEIEDCTEEL